MKRKLVAAKAPLPSFRSDKEAAEYFDSHSVAEIWPEGQRIKLSAKLTEPIRERRAKSAISLRLASEQIAAAKRIAAGKSVGYETQLRMWIAEGIRREARRS